MVAEASSSQGGGDAQAPSGQSDQSETRDRLEQFRRRTHDMYEAVAEKPLSVAAVRVEARDADGAPAAALRTSQAVLDRELQRVYDARSLREVHAALEIAVEHLRQLETFRRIDALIDDEPADDPGACSVQLDLQERGWYSGGVQTFMQGNEGHVQGHVSLRNIFGAADQWRLTGEYGHRSSFDFAVMFRLPRAGGTSWTPDASVFRRSTNLEQYSSFTDTMRGAELGVTSTDGSTRLSYTWGWRSLSAAAAASRQVRAQRGDFLSDALRWTWVVDERDSATVHREGWGTRFVNELGGLYPGAAFQYAKQRLDWVWAAPINESVAVNVSVAGGLIYALNGASKALTTSSGGADTSPRGSGGGGAALRPATPIAERFFLGGSDTVRGFAYRGLGPSAKRRPGGDGAAGGGGGGSGGEPQRDALGGDLFASLYAGLITRLPGQLGDIGGCAHAFVNGGSAALLSEPSAAAPAAPGSPGGVEPASVPLLGALGGAVRGRMAELAATCRWSAGFGLVLPTPFGRFEANYVWVLSSQPGDLPRAGLQFGFATSPITPAGPA